MFSKSSAYIQSQTPRCHDSLVTEILPLLLSKIEIVLVTFCCCDKIPEKINLMEERIILDLCVRSFSPWSLGSIVSESMIRQNIMLGREC
jgi:hypothetical protein